jgi:RNA 2',3'-cyclic 3'-phosphodiesterase
MPHRLFIAIRPPEPVRDRLVDTMEGIEGARWVDEENLHLTLRFVGEVERPVANDLAAALGQISAGPFALTVDGVGHFDKRNRYGSRPRALWARVPRYGALYELRAKVELACQAAGLGLETRRFTPHITLARLGPDAGGIGDWLAGFGDLKAGPWDVTEFILYESHLGHTGAFYEPVTAFALRN